MTQELCTEEFPSVSVGAEQVELVAVEVATTISPAEVIVATLAVIPVSATPKLFHAGVVASSVGAKDTNMNCVSIPQVVRR